jgi:hypothetical protein
MSNEQRQSGAFSYGPFVWWIGMVIDRDDPKKLGRVRVRIHGYHSADENEIKKEDLFWAIVMLPATSSGISGVGQSPTGLVEGSTVIGFYADGHSAQSPIVMGTLVGEPEKGEGGFKDPKGEFPRSPNEADTNRLSRNEKIDETIVKTKRDNIDEAEVAKFSPSGEREKWKEKETEYASQYPKNHSFESESGHIQEFDDTPGKERYHLYHRKGTFTEISPDGSTVNKVVKDNYQVIMGDDFCHVIGKCKIHIDGATNVLIKGDATIECASNCNHLVSGDYNVRVGGNYTIETAGDLTVTTGGSETHTASLILLN